MSTFTFPFAKGGHELQVTVDFSPKTASPNSLEQPDDPEEFEVEEVKLGDLDLTDLVYDLATDEGVAFNEDVYQAFIDWRAKQLDAALDDRDGDDD